MANDERECRERIVHEPDAALHGQQGTDAGLVDEQDLHAAPASAGDANSDSRRSGSTLPPDTMLTTMAPAA